MDYMKLIDGYNPVSSVHTPITSTTVLDAFSD